MSFQRKGFNIEVGNIFLRKTVPELITASLKYLEPIFWSLHWARLDLFIQPIVLKPFCLSGTGTVELNETNIVLTLMALAGAEGLWK